MNYCGTIREADRLLREARSEASRRGDRPTCDALDEAIALVVIAEGKARWLEAPTHQW